MLKTQLQKTDQHTRFVLDRLTPKGFYQVTQAVKREVDEYAQLMNAKYRKENSDLRESNFLLKQERLALRQEVKRLKTLTGCMDGELKIFEDQAQATPEETASNYIKHLKPTLIEIAEEAL